MGRSVLYRLLGVWLGWVVLVVGGIFFGIGYRCCF